MNYELAKKLKDVGFSQESEKGDKYYFGSDGRVGFNGEGCYGGDSWMQEDDVKCPSLAELIKACGLPFDLSCRNNAEKWYAFNIGKGFRGSATGDSPEEATARLWLSLTPCSHEKEISKMIQAYAERYPAAYEGGHHAFFVGSSLVGNKQGDSARFHELKALCAKQCHG